jgi:hypothetical protein
MQWPEDYTTKVADEISGATNRHSRAMMIKLLALFLITLSCVAEALAQRPWKEVWNVHGEVRTLVETHSHIVSQAGRLVEHHPWSALTFDSDKQGRLTRQIVQTMVHQQPFARVTHDFLYDQTDRLEKINTHKEEWKISFASFGYAIFISSRLVSKTSMGITAFSYDENSRYKEETRFDQTGAILERNQYSYDASGNKTVTTYNGDGSLRALLTFVYDEAGRALEETSEHADGSYFQRRVRSYDDQGQRIGMVIYDRTGKVTGEWRFSPHGNPVFHIKYDATGQVESRTTADCEYDAQGNWRKCAWVTQKFGKTAPGVHRLVARRTITYY